MTADGHSVQVLNYSAHFLDQTRAELPRLQRFMPEDGPAMTKIADLLHRSEKMILPDQGELLDPEYTRQTHLDLLKLPFNVTAFEYAASPESGKAGPPSRHIALCWEPDPKNDIVPGLSQQLLSAHPAGGVCVLSLHCQGEDQRWSTTPGGVFVPYQSQLKKLSDMQSNGPAAIYTAQHKASANKSALDIITFTALPEMYALAQAKLGVNEATALVLNTTQRDVQALIGACAVLNCKNIVTEQLQPPAKLNKKRAEKGKQPFYVYKVLDIEKPKAVSARGGPTSPANEGFRPREHLRRAHIRHYDDGHTTCIAQRLINPGIEKGTVLKQYRVQPTKGHLPNA